MTIYTATKRKPRSLHEQLESPDALHRLWIDRSTFPDFTLRSWCGGSLALVDSDPATTLRSVAFARTHSRCGADKCVAEKEDKAS